MASRASSPLLQVTAVLSTTALLENQLNPLIEKGVCAAVYTQLTDVETEINGLVTYDRPVVKIQLALGANHIANGRKIT